MNGNNWFEFVNLEGLGTRLDEIRQEQEKDEHIFKILTYRFQKLRPRKDLMLENGKEDEDANFVNEIRQILFAKVET